jgi:hypothetical protein
VEDLEGLVKLWNFYGFFSWRNSPSWQWKYRQGRSRYEGKSDEEAMTMMTRKG